MWGHNLVIEVDGLAGGVLVDVAGNLNVSSTLLNDARMEDIEPYSLLSAYFMPLHIQKLHSFGL